MDEKLKSLTLQVLEQGYLLSLGIVDNDGVWVADVIYTFDDDLILYWMSKDQRRHSQAIIHNPQVAGTITISTQRDIPDAGLQISGKAEQVDDIPWECVLRYFRKRGKPDPRPGDDVLGDHVWYTLIPDKIELIYKKEFGHERQKVK